MGELIITSPKGKVTNIMVNTRLDEHVLDSIIAKHLEYYAPTSSHVVDYRELY